MVFYILAEEQNIQTCALQAPGTTQFPRALGFTAYRESLHL